MTQLEVGLYKTYNLHGPLLTFIFIFLYAAGIDYTPVSQNLTFNAAFTTQIVEVPIIGDHIVEHSEVINLTLVSTDSAVILNPSTSTITIEDVDSKLLCYFVGHSIYARTSEIYSH